MKLTFIVLVLLTGSNLYVFCYDTKNDTDIDLHCRQFDFETKLNISVGNNITVVYNSSLCKKCMQKLLLFKALQNRFELASYNELTFIMLTMEHRGTEQFKEFENKSGNIIILSLHEISNEFFMPKSFYVFDKCGRLTYELSSPFSEIQNQIVKAAILSTWFDSPCGNCNTDAIDNPFYSEDNYITSEEIEDTQNTNTVQNTNIAQTPENVPNFDNINFEYHDISEGENLPEDMSYVIPLRIIISSEHVHMDNSSDTYEKYNHFVLNSNDSYYHEHLGQDNFETLQKDTENSNAINLTNNQYDNSISDIKLVNENGLKYEIIKNYSVLDNDGNKIVEYQEVKPSKTITIITTPAEEKSEKNFRDVKNSSRVFSALNPWISFRLRQLV